MKWKHTITLCLLGGFLLVFGLWSVLRPADTISETERRPLAQAPQWSLENALSGKLANQVDSFSADQFPLREEFRTLHFLASYDLFRQRDVEGVYLWEGYAAKLDFPLRAESVSHAAQRFQYVYDSYLKDTDCKLYLSVVPDKGYFMAQSSGRPAMDYAALVEQIRQETPYLSYIDIFGTLSLEDYYRSDAHWRQECLTDTANVLAAGLGVDVRADYREQILDKDYYGVYCGYASLPMEPERVHYLTSDTLEGCVVTNFENGTQGAVYDMDKGLGSDPYELFLSGSVSLLTVENPAAQTDRELVIFRDSFASSLAPLLLEGYSKVTLVDIRYLSPAQLGNFLEFGNQDVLFLYSTSVLNNSETLK